MTQSDFLGTIVSLLDGTHIPFMLCGSLGSSYWGEPRATFDVDIVVEATLPQIREFVGKIPEGYYVSEEAARQAVASHSMFNVIDPRSGSKVDLILRKPRPFSLEEFSRRKPARILDRDVFVASPEDVILSKLEWSQMGESERQLRDAAGVLRVQASVDEMYLDRWARELGVAAELQIARDLAASD